MDENLIKIKSLEVVDELPDPFLMNDGKRVRTLQDWKKRREELFRTAVELHYGTLPPSPEFLDIAPMYRGDSIDVFRITSATRENPVSFTVRLLHPEGKGPWPTVIDGDLSFPEYFTKDLVNVMLSKGYAAALFDRTEIVPDIREAGRSSGLYLSYPDRDFGAIGAWAWGYSRVLDALLKLGLADETCIIFTGHSRGGKTAMLAGVTDERATIVNPNETCAGSCSCYRLFMEAETEDGNVARSERLSDLMRNFPFWMGQGLHEYADDPRRLPFDCHELKALVAPRVLFVSEAASDIWASPVGSWMTTEAAAEVYRFLGAQDSLFWYFRNGYHGHNVRDFEMLINIAEHMRHGEPLSEDFFKTPFKPVKPIYGWSAPVRED